MLNRGMLRTCLLAVCALSIVSARAVGPEVRDNAGIFSAPAVKQADEAIRNLQRDFRKELLVETFAAVPDSRTNDYARSREEFFTSFVRERAQAARLDGIYVLVMKEPPPHRYRIQVGVGQATIQRAFQARDRDELVRLLQSNFREDKFDEGLRSAVGFVERTLRSNLQSGAAPRPVAQGAPVRQSAPASSSSSSYSMGSLLVLGLFVVGGVLVVGFIMRMLRSGMGGGGGLAGSGGLRGGGGGFFSSLLGGIGGAMAGSWLYDRFMSNNAHASDNNNANQPDASQSDVSGDYSSSGGDVGSGGGDFGGGGGGDFGGGGGDA